MSQLFPGVRPQLLHLIHVIHTYAKTTALGLGNNALRNELCYSRNISRNLPTLSSSCFVLDSWAPDRISGNSFGTVHIPTVAEGHIKGEIIND